MHSDSKNFTRRSGDSKGFARNNPNMNFKFEHLNEMVTTLRRENDSLKKKMKKHKKRKSKTAKNLQRQLVKLLEGQFLIFDSIFFE